MRKKLTSFGNSVGFILERPVLELLRIERDTEFEVTTDGTKLIFEPIQTVAARLPPQVQPGTVERDLDFTAPSTTHRIINDLEREFGLTLERFRRLHHFRERATLGGHKGYAPGRYREGESNETTARRLHACLARLRAGDSWEQAIQAAHRQYPIA